MDELIDQLNEINWKQVGAGAAIAGTLLTGVPKMAVAATPTTHSQRKHHHHGLPVKYYSEQDIINTIVGEASDQEYRGMLALACAIRNRTNVPYYKNNILHGVYGLNAPHIKGESSEIFALARKAWAESATRDIVGKAYIWGTNSDIVKFKQQSWFKNVESTITIKDHTFFKDKKM
jgi:hypothetical protein